MSDNTYLKGRYTSVHLLPDLSDAKPRHRMRLRSSFAFATRDSPEDRTSLIISPTHQPLASPIPDE